MSFCLNSEFEWLPYFVIISILVLIVIAFGIGYLYGQEKKK
jgi:hypothetical protein